MYSSIEEYFDLVEEKIDLVADTIAVNKTFNIYGKNWLIGTLCKYHFKYTKEKDLNHLLHLSVYCYTTWLKRGFNIKDEGFEHQIKVNKKFKKYYNLFCNEIFNLVIRCNKKYELNKLSEYINTILKDISHRDFNKISSIELINLFKYCFLIWSIERAE